MNPSSESQRQVRALLASIVLGVQSCAASRYDDCAESVDGLITEALKVENYSGPLPRQALARSVLIHECVAGFGLVAYDTDVASPSGDAMMASYLKFRLIGEPTPAPPAAVQSEAPPQPQSPPVSTGPANPYGFEDGPQLDAPVGAKDPANPYGFEDGPQPPLFGTLPKPRASDRYKFTDSPDLAPTPP